MTIEATPINFKNNFVQIINGKVAPTQTTRHGINPANKQSLPPVPVATEKDVNDAVLAGKTAFNTWSRLPYENRKNSVLAYAGAIGAHTAQFTQLLTQEHGKPLAEAQHEVELLPLFLGGHAQLSLPKSIVEDSEQRTVVTGYVPLGVVAAIVPWNYPLLLAVGKIAPALLTGNVIIVKPSPFTPYCGLKLVELAQQFFPPGVIQSLSGNDDLGPWMTSHPGFDKISFTGSVATGKKVMQSASKNLARVTLELGGNDAAIILPDVDVEEVAAQVAANAFMNSGQVCVSIKRIYIHEDIYEKFRDAMVRIVEDYTIGDGLLETTTHGPLQNFLQYEKVKTFFDDIKKEGWKVAAGGEVQPSSGYFIKPTIIDRPADESRIVVEEQFGPIVPLLSWKDEQDVIARVNDSSMGLGASIWAGDVNKANQLATEVQAGSVWVNAHTALTPMATFGGHKQSGLGSEWGLDGMKSYCNPQTLFLAKSLV